MDWLTEKRREIDEIDQQIVELIGKRIECVLEVGKYKLENDIPVMQYGRIDEIMEKRASLAKRCGLEPKLIQDVYKLLIDYACKEENRILFQNQEKQEVQMVKICTLGPEGTCHDNAVRKYLEFQKIESGQYQIFYVSDFEDAVKMVKEGKIDYIIQNCAHPQVGILNEKYRNDIYIIDSYVCPTKSMGVLKRKDATKKVIGIMPAARHYIDDKKWDSIQYESANPLVKTGLLDKKYDYGITFVDAVKEYPDELELVEDFGGPVDTTWIVYGKEKRNIYKCVLGTDLHDYFVKER